MKTDELLLKLSNKFPTPQYAFLSQVRNQTGYGGADGIRTADAMALGLWPSRGNHLHGFELKVSRSDWLSELKNPAKAEAVAKYCDMFSLVIPDLKIIEMDELPKTWGLMVANGRGGAMKVIKEAPLLKSKPMTREFLCGFLRNVQNDISKNYVKRYEVDTAIKEGVERKISGQTYQLESVSENYKTLQDNIRKFEKASGLNLSALQYGWKKPEKIGDAVRAVLNGEAGKIEDQLDRLRGVAKSILEGIEDALKEVKE